MNGSVTVPSSRSVPRDLPVRSTGPETSSTSSSIWKARPIRRAKAPSASASAAEPLSRRQRPEPAGGLEQRRRLQLAAAQVALDGDMRGVGVLALQQLALGERRAGVRERPQLGGVVVAGELGEGPREQQVAGGDRGLAARPRRRPWGGPRRSCGAVDQVVVDERRRVHELDGDRGAHQALLALRRGAGPPAASAASTTSSGRRRLPPAVDGRVGDAPPAASRLRGHALEVALGARHPLAQRRRRRGA